MSPTPRRKRVQPPVTTPQSGVVTVPSAEEMDDETFFRHYNARHRPDVGLAEPLHYHQTLSEGLVKTYRAFHKRCHEIDDAAYNHQHV